MARQVNPTGAMPKFAAGNGSSRRRAFTGPAMIINPAGLVLLKGRGQTAIMNEGTNQLPRRSQNFRHKAGEEDEPRIPVRAEEVQRKGAVARIDPDNLKGKMPRE